MILKALYLLNKLLKSVSGKNLVKLPCWTLSQAPFPGTGSPHFIIQSTAAALNKLRMIRVNPLRYSDCTWEKHLAMHARSFFWGVLLYLVYNLHNYVLSAAVYIVDLRYLLNTTTAVWSMDSLTILTKFYSSAATDFPWCCYLINNGECPYLYFSNLTLVYLHLDLPRLCSSRSIRGLCCCCQSLPDMLLPSCI